LRIPLVHYPRRDIVVIVVILSRASCFSYAANGPAGL